MCTWCCFKQPQRRIRDGVMSEQSDHLLVLGSTHQKSSQMSQSRVVTSVSVDANVGAGIALYACVMWCTDVYVCQCFVQMCRCMCACQSWREHADVLHAKVQSELFLIKSMSKKNGLLGPLGRPPGFHKMTPESPNEHLGGAGASGDRHDSRRGPQEKEKQLGGPAKEGPAKVAAGERAGPVNGEHVSFLWNFIFQSFEKTATKTRARSSGGQPRFEGMCPFWGSPLCCQKQMWMVLRSTSNPS